MYNNLVQYTEIGRGPRGPRGRSGPPGPRGRSGSPGGGIEPDELL